MLQWGKTVLMYATGKGDLQMINELLKVGANVAAVDHVLHLRSSLSLPILIADDRTGKMFFPMPPAPEIIPKSLPCSRR
jgi:hypothetical protein